MKTSFVFLLLYSLMNISNSSANENNFNNACMQQLMAGNSTFLIQVKKQKPEYYDDALKTSENDANSICGCLKSSLNDHFEILGINKDISFQQIALSFETGNKHYMTKNLRYTLGQASIPCIVN